MIFHSYSREKFSMAVAPSANLKVAFTIEIETSSLSCWKKKKLLKTYKMEVQTLLDWVFGISVDIEKSPEDDLNSHFLSLMWSFGASEVGVSLDIMRK